MFCHVYLSPSSLPCPVLLLLRVRIICPPPYFLLFPLVFCIYVCSPLFFFLSSSLSLQFSFSILPLLFSQSFTTHSFLSLMFINPSPFILFLTLFSSFSFPLFFISFFYIIFSSIPLFLFTLYFFTLYFFFSPYRAF